MAAKKKATAKPTKTLEQTLWDAADKLRGNLEASEYKHVVLGLVFLNVPVLKVGGYSLILLAKFRQLRVDIHSLSIVTQHPTRHSNLVLYCL